MNIRELAELAGVSISTVSKIINGKDQDIGEETRKKVQLVIKQNDYIPYAKTRRNLVLSSHLIGVVLSGFDSFSTAFLSGAEMSAAREGYSIIASAEKSDSEQLRQRLGVLCDKGVEAVLLLTEGSIDHDTLAVLVEAEVPYLVVGSANCGAVPAVFYSEAQKSAAAVNYLAALKHMHISLIISNRDDAISADIQNGYISALCAHGIDAQPENIIKFDAGDGHDAISRLLSSGTGAVICETPEIAYTISAGLKRSSIEIPQDISVLCLNDAAALGLHAPAITSVAVPAEMLGVKAVQRLIKSLESREDMAAMPREEVLPELIYRESCAEPSFQGRGRGERIIIIGSMNMDVIIRLPKMPECGELFLARSVSHLPGGKGANQAVAVGKLNGRAYALGRLGRDDDGKQILESLKENRVNSMGVLFENTETGKAFITVPPDGESSIVVYPGANDSFDPKHIDYFSGIFDDAKYCLLSMEISGDTVRRAIELCGEKKVQILLKPSAISELESDLYSKIDYLIPNKNELNQLVPGKGSIEEKAAILRKKGVKNVIVTLDKNGCYLLNAKHSHFFPAANFPAVDTTGAADAFIAALAVSLSEGNEIIQAIRFATLAAGISITREGAIPSLPDRSAMKMYEGMLYEHIPSNPYNLAQERELLL